jgi:phosphatidylglycerophosphatase A
MIGIQNQDTLRRLNFRHPATWVATWGGLGLMRPGPGTWGTIGGLPFGIFLLVFGGVPALVVAALAVFALGYWASKHFEQMVREKDSSMIVIDEVAGLWIAMIPCVLTPASVGIAFVLFRFFDILKPWPISYLDKKFPGPMGVMLDDVLAGIFAAFVLIGIRYVGFG